MWSLVGRACFFSNKDVPVGNSLEEEVEEEKEEEEEAKRGRIKIFTKGKHM